MAGPNMEETNRRRRIITRASAQSQTYDAPAVPTLELSTPEVPFSSHEVDSSVPTSSAPGSSIPASSVPSASSRTRGYSKSVATSRPQPPGAPQKRQVIIPDGTDRPVCENASALVTEIGVLVHNHIPLRYATWNQVPHEYKDQIIHRITDLFDIDMKHLPHKNFVNGKMMDSAKEFSCELHRAYRQNVAEHGVIEAKRKRLPRVHTDEDWEILVERWESEAFQNKSRQNALNRSRLPWGHKAGSKSYAKFFAELKMREPDAGYIRLFEHTHARPNENGEPEWINDTAKEKHEEMVALLTPLPPTEGNMDDAAPTPFPSEPEVLERVLGTKSGYVRGLGKALSLHHPGRVPHRAHP